MSRSSRSRSSTFKDYNFNITSEESDEGSDIENSQDESDISRSDDETGNTSNEESLESVGSEDEDSIESIGSAGSGEEESIEEPELKDNTFEELRSVSPVRQSNANYNYQAELVKEPSCPLRLRSDMNYNFPLLNTPLLTDKVNELARTHFEVDPTKNLGYPPFWKQYADPKYIGNLTLKDAGEIEKFKAFVDKFNQKKEELQAAVDQLKKDTQTYKQIQTDLASNLPGATKFDIYRKSFDKFQNIVSQIDQYANPSTLDSKFGMMKEDLTEEFNQIKDVFKNANRASIPDQAKLEQMITDFPTDLAKNVTDYTTNLNTIKTLAGEFQGNIQTLLAQQAQGTI